MRSVAAAISKWTRQPGWNSLNKKDYFFITAVVIVLLFWYLVSLLLFKLWSQCIHISIWITYSAIYSLGQNCGNITYFVWDGCVGTFSLPKAIFINFLVIWNLVLTRLKMKSEPLRYSITRHDFLATQSAQYHYWLSHFSGIIIDNLLHMTFDLLLPVMLMKVYCDLLVLYCHNKLITPTLCCV